MIVSLAHQDMSSRESLFVVNLLALTDSRSFRGLKFLTSGTRDVLPCHRFVARDVMAIFGRPV